MTWIKFLLQGSCRNTTPFSKSDQDFPGGRLPEADHARFILQSDDYAFAFRPRAVRRPYHRAERQTIPAKLKEILHPTNHSARGERPKIKLPNGLTANLR